MTIECCFFNMAFFIDRYESFFSFPQKMNFVFLIFAELLFMSYFVLYVNDENKNCILLPELRSAITEVDREMFFLRRVEYVRRGNHQQGAGKKTLEQTH